MSKMTHTLNAADFAEILSRTLELAREAGLIVGVRDADVNDKRPAGLMIFVAGLRTNGDGSIGAREFEPFVAEAE